MIGCLICGRTNDRFPCFVHFSHLGFLSHELWWIASEMWCEPSIKLLDDINFRSGFQCWWQCFWCTENITTIFSPDICVHRVGSHLWVTDSADLSRFCVYSDPSGMNLKIMQSEISNIFSSTSLAISPNTFYWISHALQDGPFVYRIVTIPLAFMSWLCSRIVLSVPEGIPPNCNRCRFLLVTTERYPCDSSLKHFITFVLSCGF